MVAYSCVVSTILLVILLTGAASKPQDELTVQRINIVEPNGTLRMVISNHDRLPGIIVHGKEQAFARPQAGMIFYNDEASENGGLIFGGRRNEKGEVVDSGGSLSFDKYDANQTVQLIGVDDKEDRFSGLIVSDSLSGNEGHRRIWVGRDEHGDASIELMDGHGKKRIVMQVGTNGDPSLTFLDQNGAVINRLAPSAEKH